MIEVMFRMRNRGERPDAGAEGGQPSSKVARGSHKMDRRYIGFGRTKASRSAVRKNPLVLLVDHPAGQSSS